MSIIKLWGNFNHPQFWTHCCVTMSDIKNYEVTSEYSKALLKQIENEIPHITLRTEDGHGNREYEPNKRLDEKVRALLLSLQLSVRI